ncbi:unnamed protein product [Brassica oleracea var. botrytis]|uniref:(rape) hypothetical protein n=1 Tax=Brassica napus TaxID=3708 RepID=A0A816MDW6_BRANA|nr:unnamed protein product [Brassica napus]
MQFCPSGIWDSDHTKTPLGLEMLLINEQGGLTPICHTWFLGSIYRLTNFYGSKSKIVYRVAEPNVTVTISWNSVLSVSADSTAGFPEDRLRFYGHKEFDEVLRPEALNPEGILDGNLDEEAEDGKGKSADEKVKKSSDVVESAEV